MLLRDVGFAFIVCLAIFTLSALPSMSQETSRDKQLSELADAERAFAAFTVKEGFREGFMRFFADDGIGFGPHPQRTKEVLQKRPPETGPRILIFNWAPMFGDISAAGDLGYTTGPVLFTPQGANAKPPWHGIYFSVWQKQSDGGWKVVVDMGVDTPNAVAPIDTNFASARSVVRENAKLKNEPVDLSQLDVQFSEKIGKKGMAIAYANTLDRAEFRLHRKGKMPVTSEVDLVGHLMSGDRFAYIGGKAAVSNDLAFTYGKYLAGKSGAETEAGYYVHVWRRDAKGAWKLVVDVQNPLPGTEKK